MNYLLINPHQRGTPGRRAAKTSGTGRKLHRNPSPAQLAARKLFAQRARSGAWSSTKSPSMSNASPRRKRKLNRNPSNASAAYRDHQSQLAHRHSIGDKRVKKVASHYRNPVQPLASLPTGRKRRKRRLNRNPIRLPPKFGHTVVLPAVLAAGGGILVSAVNGMLIDKLPLPAGAKTGYGRHLVRIGTAVGVGMVAVAALPAKYGPAVAAGGVTIATFQLFLDVVRQKAGNKVTLSQLAGLTDPGALTGGDDIGSTTSVDHMLNGLADLSRITGNGTDAASQTLLPLRTGSDATTANYSGLSGLASPDGGADPMTASYL